MGLAPFSLPARAGKLLDCEVIDATPIGGGSLSQVFRIRLVDDRAAIVKGGPDPVLEAEMLSAIRAAGAPAPAILAADESCLVIEELPSGGHIGAAWADLGHRLAKLHSRLDSSYGWRKDYAFGEVSIMNSPVTNWPDFWVQRRLLPQLPYLDVDFARRIEAVANDIHEYLPAGPAASLLHGDLWGGNILVHERLVSGFVDPACYFGHAEVDIAMLRVFDEPGDEFYSAYGTLEPGYRERLAIYSLWPALVHVRLFGAGYLPMTDRYLRSVGH